MIEDIIAPAAGPLLRSLRLRACRRLTDACCTYLSRSSFPRLEHLWLPAVISRAAVRRLRGESNAFVAHPFADMDTNDAETFFSDESIK
jgi:hypothetical protein